MNDLAIPQRTGPFLSVWLPSVVVIIASGGCLFSLSWWISQSPGGGADLGLVIGVSSVISLVTATVLAGAVDRADRRKTLLRLLGALVVPLAALVVVFGVPPTGVAILLAGACYVLISTVETLYLATTETVAVDLAPSQWPSARTALLTQIHSQVERIIAPTLAGLLIAAGAIRTIPAVAIAVVACVAGVVVVGRKHIDLVTARTAAAGGSDHDDVGALRRLVRDGTAAAKLVRSHRDLVFLIQLGILGNLVVFPFYAVLPAFITDYVPAAESALWFSRAATAYGAGMLVGTITLARVRRDLGGHRAIFAATCCLGLICLVLVGVTLTGDPRVVVAAMAVDGALFAVLVAVGGSVWLNRTPAEIRVRVFSLRRLTVFSSIPLGTMLMGFGGAAIGYRSFTRLLAILVLVLLVAAWTRLRWTLRTPALPAPQEEIR